MTPGVHYEDSKKQVNKKSRMVRNHKNASCGSTWHIRLSLADLLYQGSRPRK